MADEKKKITYIQTSEHAIVGQTGGPAAVLAPGERVEYNEDAASHKALRAGIEGGDPRYEHLSIVEVDLRQEAKQAEEEKEMLAKAEKIAAEARNEAAQEAQEQLERQQDAEAQRLEDGAPAATEGTDFPAQDVEAQSLAEQSGAGQRATTQDDVVEETGSGGRSGRRSSSSRRGGSRG